MSDPEDDVRAILQEQGRARRLDAKLRAERDPLDTKLLGERDSDSPALRREGNCPHGKPRWKCWTCSPPSDEELWGDFLEQYPNQRNDILRAGRESFGWEEAVA